MAGIWKMKNWFFRKICEIFEKFKNLGILSHRDLSFAHIFGVWKYVVHKLSLNIDFRSKSMIFRLLTIIFKLLHIFENRHRIRTAEIESVRLRYFLSKLLKGRGREGGFKLVCAKFCHLYGHLIQPDIYIYIYIYI